MSFTDLPWSLRMQIWEESWTSRIVTFGDADNPPPLPEFYLPPAAYVDKDAREHALRHYKLVEQRGEAEVRVNYELDTIRFYPGLGAYPEIPGDLLNFDRIERLISVSYQLCGTEGPTYTTWPQLSDHFGHGRPQSVDPELLEVFPKLEEFWVTAYDVRSPENGGSASWWRPPNLAARDTPVPACPQHIDYRYNVVNGRVDAAPLEYSVLAPVERASEGFYHDQPKWTPEFYARIQIVRANHAETRQNWIRVPKRRGTEKAYLSVFRLLWKLAALETTAFVGNGEEFLEYGEAQEINNDHDEESDEDEEQGGTRLISGNSG